jgi:uncharacterized membrane protein
MDMGILDIFGKKDVSDDLTKGVPFSMKLTFRPYRLAARKNDAVDLIVELENKTDATLLVSVVVGVPKALGFDEIGMNKVREMRVGLMKGREKKEIIVPIYGHNQTIAGDYTVRVVAYSHYRDYAHILNSVKKDTVLRAV